MAGESSILNMIITLRNNRNQLRSKSAYKNKSYFQTKSDYRKYGGGISDLKKATPEQLSAIRIKIKNRRKKEITLKLMIYLFLFMTISWLGVLGVNCSFSGLEDIESTKEKQEVEADFNFYWEDGNTYFQNGKWHNAAFQYEKALEIHPDNFPVNVRLATALTYQCEEKEIHCEKAFLLLDRLLKSHPNHQGLEALRRTCYTYME